MEIQLSLTGPANEANLYELLVGGTYIAIFFVVVVCFFEPVLLLFVLLCTCSI